MTLRSAWPTSSPGGARSSISDVRNRLPIPQPRGDQLGAFLVVAVQDAHVRRIGAQVTSGGARVDLRVSLRTSREVPGRAIGGLDSDLSRPVQLGRVRVPGPFSLPVVEDAGGIPLLLCRFAPIPRGQGAILLPRAAPDLQTPVAISRDLQEADGRRLLGAALRQGQLPPESLDAGNAALVLDRLPKLLIHGFHRGSGRRFTVPHARETVEIARELRALRMENEGSAHSENATEKTRFENHVVPRRSLTGFGEIGSGRAVGRPVIPSEHERGEIHL